MVSGPRRQSSAGDEELAADWNGAEFHGGEDGARATGGETGSPGQQWQAMTAYLGGSSHESKAIASYNSSYKWIKPTYPYLSHL